LCIILTSRHHWGGEPDNLSSLWPMNQPSTLPISTNRMQRRYGKVATLSRGCSVHVSAGREAERLFG
jgi:hypothetical protein